MKRIFLTISILFSALTILGAQNFNPQVEVTNEYRSQISDLQKQEVKMEVPDSLMSFNYNLDYTVFDQPYKGSYEFKPYLIEMAPEKRTPDSRRLYLSAGAGYTLSPELDFVFTPRSEGAVKGSLYDSFRGYFGPVKATADDKDFNASLYHNTVGLRGTVAGRKTTYEGSLAYDRRYASADGLTNGLDLITVGGSFQEMPVSKGMLLDARAGLSFGSGNQKGGLSLTEFGVDLGGELSARIGGSAARAAVEAGVSALMYGGDAKATGVHLYAVPKYVIKSDVAALSAGVKFSMLPTSLSDKPDFAYRSALIFPDVHGHVFIYEDKVKIFADVTGGDHLNTLAEMMDFSPFAVTMPLNATATPVLDASAERVNAVAGIGGSIKRCFQYKVWGGYVVAENALVDTYVATVTPGRPLAGLLWQNYKYAQAGVAADYVTSALEVGAKLDYKSVSSLKDGFGPSPLSVSARARYNWMGRVYAGLYVDHVAAREHAAAGFADIPAYTDLGLFGEYVFNHNFSLWLRADNLLGQDIWKYMAHGRNGVNITAGICLNIR